MPDVWLGVTSIFRDYGYRRLRNKARLKYLVADWGAEKFREVLETEYLGAPLPDGPAAPKPLTQGDHVGVHRQKDGRFYIGVTPFVGRVSGSTLTAIADVLERHGLGAPAHDAAPEARAPRHAEEAEVEQVIAELDAIGPVGPPQPHPSRHDRVHGHRVLQARHRRDQADRDERGHRPRASGSPASTCRIRSACT